jgi:FMN phosphatase YigB (HAD superfamily)
MANKPKRNIKTIVQPKDHDKIRVKGVVNIKKEFLVQNGYTDFSDWASYDDHVYIGRDMSFYVPGAKGSIWQNPYPLCIPGKKYKDKKPRYTLDESLELYEQYIISNPDLMSRLNELNGKILGCWCVSNSDKTNRCHGNVLKKLVKEHCNP